MLNNKSILTKFPTVKCKLFHTKAYSPFSGGAEDYARLYDFWLEGWNSIMQKLDGTAMTPEQLIDKDVAISLWDDEGPAGLICSTYFPNRFPWTAHPYFSMYSKEYLVMLQREGINHMWTMQWIYVSRRMSAKNTGISFASVLIGLLLKYCEEASRGAAQCAAITMARADVPAAKLARDWGAKLLNQVGLHNVPCEELYTPGFKHVHEDPSMNELVRHLWQQKIDYREGIYHERQDRAA